MIERANASRLLRRRLAAENTRFEVYFDQLVGPDGTEVPNYLTVRPRIQHGDLVSGVCVLPEVDGRIGLMLSHRHIFSDPVWQAPAGFSEMGEDPAATALRELQEETGFKCPPARLESLGYMLPDAGVLLARVALFVARGLRTTDRRSDERAAWEPGLGDLEYFEPGALADLLTSDPNVGGATLTAGFRYLHRFAAPESASRRDHPGTIVR